MASKYKGIVPTQEFMVQRQIAPSGKWQRTLARSGCKVWEPALWVEAHTGPEACRIAKRQSSSLRTYRLRAIPTFNTESKIKHLRGEWL